MSGKARTDHKSRFLGSEYVYDENPTCKVCVLF
jgi:hypothetical protein